jgi:polar amino acid transport system substrate-binding protein
MLKKFLCLAFLLACLAAAPLAAAETYINGIDADYPPFAFIDTDGAAAGFDIDVINWIAAKKGFEVKHQSVPWSTIIPELKAKKISFIASGLSVTPERAQEIAYSKPYWVIKQVAVVSQDSAITVEKLFTSGLKIGVQQGTSDEAAMEKANGVDGRSYTLVPYSTPSLAAQDVVNGRIDGAVLNDIRAAAAVASQAVKVIGSAGVPDEEYAIGVHKDDVELLATLNEGLDLIMADPIWQELVEKHKIVEAYL